MGGKDIPIFTTGIASELTGIKRKKIINYESSGLLKVARSEKNRRLFSKKDLRTLLLIENLTSEKNLTYQGAKYVLSLIENTAKEGINLVNYILSKKERDELEKILEI